MCSLKCGTFTHMEQDKSSETESKMENPTHIFKETNLVIQLIYKLRIKSKTVMSWNKKSAFFNVYFVQGKFFYYFCFFAIYSVLNKYTFIYQKLQLYTLFCLFLKSWKAFRVSLRFFCTVNIVLDFNF